MIRRGRSLLPFVLFLFPCVLGAATPRLPIRRYTSADGLAQDAVQRIKFDPQGFLWVATAGGLSRFDGDRFTGFGEEDGLRGRVVYDLAFGLDGTYWVATNAGLFAFRPGESAPPGRLFREVPLEGVPEHDSPHRLLVDGAGDLWVGTMDRLWRVTTAGREHHAHPVTGELHSRVQCLAADPEGNVWVGTHSDGIYRVGRGGRVDHCPWQTRGAWFVRDFHFPGDGTVWVAHLGGVAIFPGPPFGEPAPQARIYGNDEGMEIDTTGFLPRGKDAVLVGTTAGIIEMRRAGSAWQVGPRLDRRSGLPSDSVASMARDTAGTLWLGMTRRGVVKLLQNGFATFDGIEGPGSILVDLTTDRAGRMVVLATQGAKALTAYAPDAEGREPIPVKLLSPVSYVGWGGGQKWLVDRRGTWWIATGDGVLRYDDPRGLGVRRLANVPDAVYGLAQGLSGNDAFILAEDVAGDVWISATAERPGTSTLSRWSHTTERIETFPESVTGSKSLARRFLQTRDGTLWILFLDGTLFWFRQGRLEPVPGWAASGIDAGEMYEDRSGRLWMLGSSVHVCADPRSAQPQFVASDLGGEARGGVFHCAVEGVDGRMWFGTDHGVLRMDPVTGALRRFDVEDGLVGNSIHLCERDGTGRLWFSDIGGLSRYDAQPDTPRVLEPARLREIQVAGEPVPLPSTGATSAGVLTIPPDQRRLSVDFFAVHYGPGPPLRFQYKLERDAEWSVPAGHGRVQYADLAPGRYRFLVRTVSEDGRPSDAPASISLDVLAPVWRRGWFLAMALSLAAGLVYVGHRVRVARAIAVERVRTRIATDLHDDIGSSLSQIAILSQVASRDSARGAAGTSAALQRITALSGELIDGMSDVVWAISPRWDTVSSLVYRMRRFATELFPDEEGVVLELLLPEKDEERIDPDVRRQIYLVFKEALHNVRRHAAAEHVRVELQRRGSQWVLRVEEDGKGFDLGGQASQGQGLTSMRRRAERLGARLDIRSSPHGTSVTLEIPERLLPRKLSDR